MYIYEFDNWCKQAVKGIKYPPDRKSVYTELYDHLEDRYGDFISQGFEKEPAVQETLTVMGDAKELSAMLAQIHRPFWGFLYSFSKWLLICATALMLLYMGIYLYHSNFSTSAADFAYEPYTDTSQTDEFGRKWERTLYTEPDAKASSDGYTFTITRAAQWQITDTEVSERQDLSQLHFQLKVTNPCPWAVHTDIVRWFWAVDSLGNHYYSSYERNLSTDSAILVSYARTGLFTDSYEIFCDNYVSSDAEWIELHYDRSGRDIVLRIDLTGGEN